MDIPFSSLKYILNEENSKPNAPRYEPYGIFIDKKLAYRKGIRPVLYLSNDEIKALEIPKSELWRVLRLEVRNDEWISWVHEREWRCKGNFVLQPKSTSILINRGNNGIGVLVKTYNDLTRL